MYDYCLNLVSEDDPKNLIVREILTNRTFIINTDVKISKYGFGKFNLRSCILHALNVKIDEMLIDLWPHLMIIDLLLCDDKKEYWHHIECEETFIDASMDENMVDRTTDELKRIIVSLRHQVSNLTEQLRLEKIRNDDESSC